MQDHLRMIHTADWHLGSPLTSLPPEIRLAVREAQRRMMERLTGQIRENGIRYLLLAGDIFDRPDPAHVDVQVFANFLNLISPCTVVVSPGNHDPYVRGCVWEKLKTLPNLFVFDGTVRRFQFPADAVCIDGSAFCRSTPADTGSFVPLTAPDFNCFRILLLHGSVYGQKAPDAYACLDLRRTELSVYDYIAMGHEHSYRADTLKIFAPESVRNGTQIVYPGFLQGRGFDETGAGSYIELIASRINREKQIRCIRHMYQDFVFCAEEIEMTFMESASDIKQALLALQSKIRSAYPYSHGFISLQLKGSSPRGMHLDLAALEKALSRDSGFLWQIRLVNAQASALPLFAEDRLFQECLALNRLTAEETQLLRLLLMDERKSDEIITGLLSRSGERRGNSDAD